MANESENDIEWKISSLCGDVNLGKKKPLTDEDKEPFRKHLQAHERRCNRCRKAKGFTVIPRTKPDSRRGKQSKAEKELEKIDDIKKLGETMNEEPIQEEKTVREIDEPEMIMPIPNKVTIQYGQVLVGIESADESTETICNFAMQSIHNLLGVVPKPEQEAPKAEQPEEKPVKDQNADLAGQDEYERLMKGIKGT